LARSIGWLCTRKREDPILRWQGGRAAANGLRPSTKLWLAFSAAAIMLLMSAADVVASDMTTTKAWSMPVAPTAHDWSGFYVGGHVGYAAMSSYWNSEALGAPTLSGSTEIFDDDGPWGPLFGGLQAGYNYVLASQLLAGVEADVSFPNHLSATRQLSSAAEGQFSVADTVEFFATARTRVGLAANNLASLRHRRFRV